MSTDLETSLRETCDDAFGSLALPAWRVQEAVSAGRRRRRWRLASRTATVAGLAALAVAGVVAVRHPDSAPPALLGPAGSPAAAAQGTDVDGVTVSVLPSGYALVSTTAAFQEAGLPCLTEARAAFLPAGTSASSPLVRTDRLVEIRVARGPVTLPDPAGGPSFGPTDVGHLVTSPYRGPGERVVPVTTYTVQLGPELVVTVMGTDLDAATVRSVAAGLRVGPADQLPSPAASVPAIGPSVHAAHC